MADEKLSALSDYVTTAGIPPADDDVLYFVDVTGPTSYKIKVSDVFSWIKKGASLTPMVGDADDFASNFTGIYLYGGVYVCNATGTVVLPSVAVGMNFSIITLGDIEVIIDPNASDSMLSDGVQGADGENLSNLSSSGDIAVVQYYSSAGWLVTTNGWTPE